MGFLGIKKQLLKVIEWEDSTKNTVVYRYPLTDRTEIMNSSTLVVRPSQYAIFVHKGVIADVFAPGSYKLASENIPFLTKLLSLPTAGDSPIKAEVYFVNTKQFTAQKWGTQNPIMMRDSDFGNIRLRGYGVYAFKVNDPKLFMEEMFGTNNVFTTDDITAQCKPMIVQGVADAIAESKISALDLAANYKEFSQRIMDVTQPEFKKYGLTLTSVVIENLSLPEEVEKALDERTRLGLMEDKLPTATKLKAADAMVDAAQNPSGNNLAGLGIGLGAGNAMGKIFSDGLSSTIAPQEPAQTTITCGKCGAQVKPTAKFCPECGETLSKRCPKCNTEIKSNAKFCPECGEPLGKKCPNCNASLKKNTKFCPECGEKL